MALPIEEQPAEIAYGNFSKWDFDYFRNKFIWCVSLCNTYIRTHAQTHVAHVGSDSKVCSFCTQYTDTLIVTLSSVLHAERGRVDSDSKVCSCCTQYTDMLIVNARCVPLARKARIEMLTYA